MSRHLLVLSGPNLSKLGERDPAVYGTVTLDELLAATAAVAAEHGFGLRHVQSNHEGELIDAIERREAGCAGILANLGAFTHTSVIAPVVAGSIAGFGPLSYELAVLALVRLANGPGDPVA